MTIWLYNYWSLS